MIKYGDEEIKNILDVVEKNLRKEEKEKAELEDAPLFHTKTQYPLHGFPFYIPSISYIANFEEIDLYSPHSIYEVADENKRRRKPLDAQQLFISLNFETWNALKAETVRTKSGYTSGTIKTIIDENENLRNENLKLHKLIVNLVQKEQS